MDTFITAVANKRDVILTTLQGFERSRFLLKTSLISLVKAQTDKSSFERIVHVSDKDYNIGRIYNELKYMPFEEFDLKVAKIYSSDTDENKSSSLEEQNAAKLIVCHLKHIFSSASWLQNALVIFDGITLENIEGTCSDVYELNNPGQKCCSPSCVFQRLKQFCWSVVLACNTPVDGLSVELKLDPNPVVIYDPLVAAPKYRTHSSILTSGPTNVPYDFNAAVKHPNIHSEVGAVLERTAQEVKSGAILVFFPSYGRMVEYHNAWKQSGLFERLGLTFGRENRAGSIFKDGLRELAHNPKSIFLFSIRYHQDEVLAEFALSLASVVIVVGLPCPFTSDTWEARIKASNESQSSPGEGRLSGDQVYKHRGIEFMNGVLKRCLNEYRYKDCNFFLLDSKLRFEREKLARELVEAAQEETYDQSMARFHAHCSRC